MAIRNLMKVALLGASAAALAAPSAFAVTAQGTANAEIVQPIALTADESLEFGEIGADADGGTVTVAPDGTATHTGVINFGGADEFAAQFTATGVPLAAVAITLPGDDDVALAGPGANMPVNSFVSDPAAGVSALDGAGLLVIDVGATLGVNGNQLAGDYTGTFDVTVNYN